MPDSKYANTHHPMVEIKNDEEYDSDNSSSSSVSTASSSISIEDDDDVDQRLHQTIEVPRDSSPSSASSDDDDDDANQPRPNDSKNDESDSEDSDEDSVPDDKRVKMEDGTLNKTTKRTKRARNRGFARRRKVKPAGSVTKAAVVRKKGLQTVLEKVIALLKARDSYGFFLEPVPTDIVTDYLTVIKKPMDLGTMEKKVKTRQYRTYESFVEDFRLVYKNAMTYNSPDTLYYRNAEKLGQYGERFLAREGQAVTDDPEPTPPPPVLPMIKLGKGLNVSTTASPTPPPVYLKEGEATPVKKKRPYVKRQETTLAPGEKRKRGKYRTKQSIEVIMESNFEGDGSLKRRKEVEPWTVIPQTTPFERYINSKSSLFHQTLRPVSIPKTSSFPYRGLSTYIHPVTGPAIVSTPICSENPLLFSTLYGGVPQEAYARSLLEFVKDVGGEIQEMVVKRVEEMSKGGVHVARKMDQVVATGELSFQSLDHPLLESSTIIQDIERVKSVMDTCVQTSGWGTVDVCHALALPAKRKIERDFNEFEMWRASKVRVDPLLTPALVGHVDNTLTQVLNSSAPSKLVGANADDIRELQNLALARAKAMTGEQKAAPLDVSEDEKRTRERIRRRLLTLVQMVPPLELANLETPPAAAAPVQPAPQPVPVPSPAPTPKSHKKTKTPSTGPRNYPITTSTPTPRPPIAKPMPRPNPTVTAAPHPRPIHTSNQTPQRPPLRPQQWMQPTPQPLAPMPITPNYRPQQQIQQPFISPMSMSNNPMLQNNQPPQNMWSGMMQDNAPFFNQRQMQQHQFQQALADQHRGNLAQTQQMQQQQLQQALSGMMGFQNMDWMAAAAAATGGGRPPNNFFFGNNGNAQQPPQNNK